ncbi:MAG: FGGY-family carbohydrate kinase [Desulfomonile tiedjei]|nr:FGGY-family carbohydrate kinase [Desulfomonile tiedjei]
MADVILAIDCGTQSLRALLFTAKGDLLDRAGVEYEPHFRTKPGWAEQDPNLFWRSLCETCQTLKSRAPGLFERIGGVGITTQRDSMVNVDEKGVPLRPVITWLDQRKAGSVYHPWAPMRLAYRAVRMAEAIGKLQADGKCNWIRQNEPEIWDRTHKYLQVSGFLNFKLTGEFKDSVASQIGHIPFNYKKFRWASKWELASKLFPVERTKLPEVVAPGDRIGLVCPEAARETGIPEGIPVIACGSDKGCETIGMGVVNEESASLSFGTTATVQTTTKKYFEPIRFMPPYPALIAGHYNPEVEIFRGYWMITWFKNEFAHKEVLEAHDRGVAPEQVLDDLLRQVPAGSAGLLVQPYWGPGLKHSEAKGAMIGFGDVHRKPHVYRAVIEGLGYALLEGLHQMERAGKFTAERVTVSGGASQSNEICSITADIFDLPLLRGATHETAGLGAAITTSVGLGIHPSFDAAIRGMVKYEKTFEPNPQNAAIYRELYHRVYRKMYQSLQPLYEQIREITGYPEKIAETKRGA